MLSSSSAPCLGSSVHRRRDSRRALARCIPGGVVGSEKVSSRQHSPGVYSALKHPQVLAPRRACRQDAKDGFLANTTSIQSNGAASMVSIAAELLAACDKRAKPLHLAPIRSLRGAETCPPEFPESPSIQARGAIGAGSGEQPPVVQNWQKGPQIGHGSFGSVHKALNLETGHIFAVKEMYIGGSADHGNKCLEQTKRELDICSALQHKNIVSFLGHAHTEGYFYIFLEFVPGGSMAGILRDFGPLDPFPLQVATRCALNGLAYLHSRTPPVVHRDLKGANLLVELDFNVKLTDFGCSRCQADTQSFTMVGSIPWMAPEVVTQLNGHGRKADIWSLGCVMLEMATASKPWGDGAWDNVISALKHIGLTEALPHIPERLPAKCADFVRCCIRRTVDERPSAQELLHHDYVREGRGAPPVLRSALKRAVVVDA